MKLFINGGGSGQKTIEANQKFNEVLNGDQRPLLYIPFAMEKYSLESCFDWIKEELKEVNLSTIEMVKNELDLEQKNLNNYCAIFIGGGNTYTLLSKLKNNTSFDKLKEYVNNNGIIYASSAGAVICGKNIDTIKLMDQNHIKLQDSEGLNILNQFSVYPHHTNKTKEIEEQANSHLLQFNTKVLALSEETTIYIEDGKYEVLGNKTFSIFDSGKKNDFNESNNNKKE